MLASGGDRKDCVLSWTQDMVSVRFGFGWAWVGVGAYYTGHGIRSNDRLQGLSSDCVIKFTPCSSACIPNKVGS